MAPSLKDFLKRWAITTVAVLVAANMLAGIHYDNWFGLLLATLVLGLLNAFLRPLLLMAVVGVLGVFNVCLGLRLAILTMPLQIGLFGLLLLALNAILLLCVGQLVETFHVEDFRAAFWGGLIISLTSLALNSFTGSGHARVSFQRGPPRPPVRKDRDGDGPVIDV